jgi:hypothetical protein
VCERERERERMLCDLCLGVEVVEDHTREVVATPLQLSYMGVTANHMLAGIMDVSIQSPFF